MGDLGRIQIRRAAAGDEEQIAKVHIQSWQETYPGLVAQEYLDGLSAEYQERVEMWQKILASSQRWTWVAAGFGFMQSLGYRKAYCWVLDQNPTIRFYERSGARFLGQTKLEETAGQELRELAYEWDSLSLP